MTSNSLLLAACEQMAELEKEWRSKSNGDWEKPLVVTTRWYKPALNEQEKSNINATRRDSGYSESTGGGRKATQKPMQERDVANARRVGSTKKEDVPADKGKGTVRISITSSGAQNITFRGPKPTHKSGIAARKSKPGRLNTHMEKKQLTVREAKGDEAHPVLRGVRWEEPHPQRSHSKANIKARRTGPLPGPSKVQQPSQSQQRKDIVEKVKDAAAECEITDTKTTLARRLPRPRSPSRARPRFRRQATAMAEKEDVQYTSEQQQQSSKPRGNGQQKNKVKGKTSSSRHHWHQHHARHHPGHRHKIPRALPWRQHSQPQPLYGHDWRVIPAPVALPQPSYECAYQTALPHGRPPTPEQPLHLAFPGEADPRGLWYACSPLRRRR